MSSNFGELCLILGDLHIPTRASKIPAAFKRMLVPNKMQHVICTGNLSRTDYDELCSLAPNVHVVAGEYDNMDQEQAVHGGGLVFPDTRVLKVGDFRIGVIHGHQLLPWSNRRHAIERMRRMLNVDILVAGHSHKNEVKPEDGYINAVGFSRSVDFSNLQPGSFVHHGNSFAFGHFSPRDPSLVPIHRYWTM